MTAPRRTAGDLASPRIPASVPVRTRVGRLWMDLSLRRKLFSIVLLLALVCAPTITFAITLYDRLDDARRASEQTATALETLDQLEDTALVTGGGAVESFVIAGNRGPGFVETYRTAMAEVPELLVALEESTPGGLDDPLTGVTDAYATLIVALDTVMSQDLLVVSDVNAATVATAEAFDAGGRLRAALDERVADQRADVDRLQTDLGRATVGTLLVSLVAATGGTYLVTRGIAARIRQLSSSAAGFIRNERIQPSPRSNDEVGRLTDTLAFAGSLLESRRHEALAATRAKDDFLARVSHELKTPLTAMIGFAQLLEEEPDLSPESRGDADRIVHAGSHLHELIEELLDIKAIEAGKLAMAPRSVRVRDAVTAAVALVQPMANDRSVTITATAPDDVEVWADPRRLREVLLNLLSNAVKYNVERGRVDVTVARDDDTVRIRVADTGPGISDDDQQRLFEPFERLGAATTDTEGSGVGLALTKNVVNAMGGTIGVDSTPGHGSTFWFDLPTDGDGVDPADVGADAHASGPSTDRPTPSRDLPAPLPARTRAGQRWMNMSLRRKLLNIVLLIGLVCVPPLIAGLTLDSRLRGAREELAETNAAADTLADLREMLLLRAQRAIQTYAIEGFDETAEIEEYRAATAPVPEMLTELAATVPDELGDDADAVVTAMEDMIAKLDVVSMLGTELPLGPDLGEQLSTATAATDVAFATHGRLNAALDQRAAAQQNRIDDLQEALVMVTLASLVLAVTAAIAGTYMVTSGIVRRIERLSENASRFIANEPMLPVTRSRDEIGQLNQTMAHAGELLDARRNEALAATRAKDEFLSRVSHELKTPLTAMIGFAQLLEEDPDLSPESVDDAGHIVRAGHHLHRLIEELLDIKAIEAGKLAITVEPVLVCETADEAVRLLRSMAASRSITISSDCHPDAVVAADRRRLREILLNLLSNALKYNRPRGRVELTAEHRGDVVHIEVTDSGQGISSEDQKRLFRPFERLGAGSTDIEGSGVGLSLTKNVVEAMGGSIGVESTLGEGSTFWFDLPAAIEAARHVPLEEAHPRLT